MKVSTWTEFGLSGLDSRSLCRARNGVQQTAHEALENTNKRVRLAHYHMTLNES
jgi:hypothetical protein